MFHRNIWWVEIKPTDLIKGVPSERLVFILNEINDKTIFSILPNFVIRFLSISLKQIKAIAIFSITSGRLAEFSNSISKFCFPLS